MEYNRDFKRNIKAFGYHRASLVDYPGEVAGTLFLKYCNLSCDYCHNAKNMNFLPAKTEENFNDILNDMICSPSTALVITGGECTLYGKNLVMMLRHLRSCTKKKIKIDTNGTMPEVLKPIIKDKLVDFIAMDVKGHFDNYIKFGYHGDTALLYESAFMIRTSNIPYQFRTTMWDKLDENDYGFILKNFPDIKWQKEVKEQI